MSRRLSIYLDTFDHQNPIPAGCRIGNILMSGLVTGLDSTTGKIAPTLARQCALMFAHMRAIVAEAGGSTADIIKITVWLKDRSQRGPLNAEWLAMFPDPADRPVREALEVNLEGGKLIQCDFTAIIGSSRG
jgi:enamine deaminase RidA (YjgF/YER057c/UK114 family)